MINLNKHSILATDFSKVDERIEKWMLKREKKEQIYIAIEEYISFLKNSLENETDSIEIIKIKREIKKLEKEKQKYYVPSILGEYRLSPMNEETDKEQKESSNKLLKKINKHFKNK